MSFPVNDGEGEIIERMHAVPYEGNYVLDNSPFYAFGISFGDLFRAVPADGELRFVEIVSHNGHSTYRIKLLPNSDHEFFLKNWSGLEKLGCTYEGSSAGDERLYSIDVPPGVDVGEVYRVLEDGERQGIWQFEEGHYFGGTV